MTNDIDPERYRLATKEDLATKGLAVTIFHPEGGRHTDHADKFHPYFDWWKQAGWSAPYVRIA